MTEYFPEPQLLGRGLKVELDLSSYARQADFKKAAGVNVSKFVDLESLKSSVDKLGLDKLQNVPSKLRNLKNKVNKLDIDKLIPFSVDLSKLSDVVKNDVVKKDVYDAKIKILKIKYLILVT